MRTRILGGGFEGGAAFLQEAGEVLAGEAPLEGRCDSLPVVLKVEKALGECVEGGEIIGGEDFSLDDREVDFDLVEPAGMNGTVDQDQARILLLEALNGGETAMRRAVVDDPEHAAGVVIGGQVMTCSTRRSKGALPLRCSQRPKTRARCTSSAAK